MEQLVGRTSSWEVEQEGKNCFHCTTRRAPHDVLPRKGGLGLGGSDHELVYFVLQECRHFCRNLSNTEQPGSFRVQVRATLRRAVKSHTGEGDRPIREQQRRQIILFGFEKKDEDIGGRPAEEKGRQIVLYDSSATAGQPVMTVKGLRELARLDRRTGNPEKLCFSKTCDGGDGAVGEDPCVWEICRERDGELLMLLETPAPSGPPLEIYALPRQPRHRKVGGRFHL